MRVGVYVDAFNVYYGGRDHCGRGTPGWRWLDLAALSASLIDPGLWPGAVLDRIVYCTAPRDRAGDPTSIADQQTYITALQNAIVPTAVLNGQYVPRIKSGDLVHQRGRRVPSPGLSALPAWLPAKETTGPDGAPVLRAAVTTFEEKGSDVNVASHLLIDVLDHHIDAEAHRRRPPWQPDERRRSTLVAPAHRGRLHQPPIPARRRAGPTTTRLVTPVART